MLEEVSYSNKNTHRGVGVCVCVYMYTHGNYCVHMDASKYLLILVCVCVFITRCVQPHQLFTFSYMQLLETCRFVYFQPDYFLSHTCFPVYSRGASSRELNCMKHENVFCVVPLALTFTLKHPD